jgi:hypothetical protein
MNTLQRHFDDCRLPVEFVNERPPRPRSSRISPLNFNTGTPAPSADDFFYVDVAKQQRAERFRLYVHPDAEIYLREKRPASRHMMLQVRCFPNRADQPEVRNLLLGHDERQLFVVQRGTVNTLADAFDSLKPPQVRWAENRGLKVIRQGDWFFLPLRSTWLDHDGSPGGVPADGQPLGGINARSLGITVGNPHTAEEQRITIRRWWTGTQTITGITLTVRGKIRHSEHSTVELRGWHQAFQNTASRNATVSIGYYD